MEANKIAVILHNIREDKGIDKVRKQLILAEHQKEKEKEKKAGE